MGNGDVEPTVDIRTRAFRQVTQDGATQDANTLDEITLGDDRTVWRVSPIAGSNRTEVAESASPVVNRYMRYVLAKQRVAARRNVARPAPKPLPGKKGKARAVALPTAVLCPRCDGEGLAGCRLCEGVGTVTPIEATAWLEEHN